MRQLAGDVGISADRIRRWGQLFRRPLTYRVLVRRTPREAPAPRAALRRSLDWLLTAHTAASGRGFASNFSLVSGWGPSYPETSGYLVPTLRAAQAVGHRAAELEEALRRTGRWLLEIQYPDGGFDAPATGRPMIFDTGQVLFGLLAFSRGKEGEPFLLAARRAGEWIVSQQDPDGSWIRSAYRGIPHTYYSRVSWALLALASAAQEEIFRSAARRQLRWVQEQQAPDGWFARCSFHADDRPVLHVIAYTIEGLWESARILEDRDLENGAVTAAEALLRLEGEAGRLPSHLGPGWRPDGDGICVTGLCQTARIWQRMSRRYGRPDFAAAARRCLALVMRHQVENPAVAAVHGGLPGSVPLWGEYFPWAFPNWGAKFFLDALLLQEGLEDEGRMPG